MKKIATEEHFFTRKYMDYLRTRKTAPRLEATEDDKGNRIENLHHPTRVTVFSPQQVEKILDIGPIRLKEMDEAGVDMQVLSMSSPGVDELDDVDAGTEMARVINDELAESIKRNPKRFAGFASVAPGNPRAAADELKRAVTKLGLNGAKINSHGHGRYLDDKKYWPFFEAAESLGAPIYIHPTEPHPDMLKVFEGYPMLTTAVWGYAAEVGLHSMRLIFSGLFDAFPKLKIIIGHLGESIPFWFWRIDNRWNLNPTNKSGAKKSPMTYFKENFMVTTSGMFWDPALLCTYMAVGADNILFAVDYPYESSMVAAKFMDSAPICELDREKIAHLNAEKLLKLKL
ncbi:MAG: amidohydrolase family protein [Chloroflexota bacterium]